MHTDLLLVWSEDNHSTIDEARLRSFWPQCQHLQRLGPNLWLAWGVPQSATVTEANHYLSLASNRPSSGWLPCARPAIVPAKRQP
jgi:hypothetical protein